MNIIGICGRAGSGKSTSAKFLVEHRGYVEVALADAMKRICMDVYGFTADQMFGPSEKRNAPDFRYPCFDRSGVRKRFVKLMKDVFEGLGEGDDPEYIRIVHLAQVYEVARQRLKEDRQVTDRATDASEAVSAAETGWLTPRHALQQLGTQWGRDCYLDTWVDIVIRAAKALHLAQHDHETEILRYGNVAGLYYVDSCTLPEPYQGIVVSDVRYPNEAQAIQKAGGQVFKIHRPDAGLSGAAGQHSSETHVTQVVPDVLIYNDGTLDDLKYRVLMVEGSR